jgi:esterase/lipase superfamily enzyme
VRVIYGTNRERLTARDDPSDQAGYGTEPERHTGQPVEPSTYQAAYVAPEMIAQIPTTTRLETGEVIITIPALHRRGDAIRSFGSARRAVSDEDRARKFSLLQAVDPFESHQAFRERVAELYATTDARDAILHVHGFNVSFRAGAFRAAQLKYDTGFEGPVFYFSWPSNAKLTEYFNDQVDGDVSARALANFMLQMRGEVPEGGQIHVIAHSMGTRVFSQAAALLRESEAWPLTGDGALGAVILAAGDLDSGLASEWLGPPDTLAESVTFLTSKNDKAVRFSGVLRNFFLRSERRRKTRIGFFKASRGPVIFPGVNVFDISYVKAGFWEKFASTNHSTYAQDTFSLDYIAALLDDPSASPQVFAGQGLARCDAEPLRYWVLGLVTGRKVCSRDYETVNVTAKLASTAR